MLSPSLPAHLPMSTLDAVLEKTAADRAGQADARESRRKRRLLAMLIRIVLPFSLARRSPATSTSSLPSEDYPSTPPVLADSPEFWVDPFDCLVTGDGPSYGLPHKPVPLGSDRRPSDGRYQACIDPVLLRPVGMAAITSPPTQPSMFTLSASPDSGLSAPPLQKAGSAGSTGSNTASLPTPVSAHLPLSPMSGSNTPKARIAALKDASRDVRIPMSAQDTRGLANDLDQLKVQSPLAQGLQALPVTENGAEEAPRRSKSNGHTNGHGRTDSSSTESSSPSTGPAPPSHLGSVYGAEGFPNYPFDASQPNDTTVDPKLDEEALRAVMSADAAVMKLNGTSSVQSYPGYAPLPSNPYQLPRGYAGFVHPNQRPDPHPISSQHGASRQSSTSSSTTEDASTSSEESDLCVPTVEWVNIPKSGMPPLTPFFHVAQGEHRGSFGQGSKSNSSGRKSPGKMAPPLLTGRRRTSHGANGVPSGLPPLSHESALPGDVRPDAPVEEEDDEATVGHGGRRDRSPSGSSQSTGLDLLYAAAYTGQDPREHQHRGLDGKGKRKAGAGPEAIAQWRTSGIPSGVRDLDTLASADKAGVPKKRRRSSVDDENIDPALADVEMDEAVEESSSPAPEDADDEEYGARGRAKGAGRGRGGRRGGKARTSGASAGTPAKAAPAAAGKKAKKEDDFSPNGKGSGSGAGVGRRGSLGALPPNGVQCEYVNPLPPFNRCTDVFTRKYDLPRHMARHARREGELVEEGKLAEDKALLWKTIKDKPKVECAVCGESFTRMDALKRHQTKQHRE